MSTSLGSGKASKPEAATRLAALSARARIMHDVFFEVWLVPVIISLLALALVAVMGGDKSNAAAVCIGAAIGLAVLKALYDYNWRALTSVQAHLLGAWPSTYDQLWAAYRQVIDAVHRYNALTDQIAHDERQLTEDVKRLH